ncbi:CHAT domain-containing protein [Bradyrhizobium huanghuaihaiense]|uniref:CHAT domain-containing protein n=1 Tax=Bradyrhizobium huanghuaihaiense TaxID=990078 RepID=UPI0021A98D4E|nr:CHAT domain-containing protein [Bradyrhizobium sp. CB3035]UWU78165.1 CHAT domain-containing protein [Bradyrhizobium sp. CB3035]
MVTRQSIINLAGDHEETVERLSKHLGRNKLRRKLFNVIYGPGSLPRSKKQIMKAAGIRAQDAQQAQNQIDHLATHHLIVREDNDGSVKDGSRNLYRKDPNIRAIRKELIKFADNTKARDKLPTKRRPAATVIVRSVRTVTRQELKKRAHLAILYLTADPDKAHALRVDAEVRRVQEAIRGSQYRDNLGVEYRPAANVGTLLDGLNDIAPQIVHFSGHGSAYGLAMDSGKVGKRADESVSFGLLAKALAATDHPPRVVVLNSCHSSGARKPLLKLGIIVISMKTSISDIGAVAFAPRFYAALAGGQSVQAAFRQGAVAVENVSITEADTPQLFCPHGTNPGSVKLA